MVSACLPSVRRGCDSGQISYMWVEFVVGSCFSQRVFLQVLRISSLHKSRNFCKFLFDYNRGAARKPAKADVVFSLIIVNFIYMYLEELLHCM